MQRKFKVGDHVTWNSEAGRVSGKIIKGVYKRCRLQGIYAPRQRG